MSEPTSERQAKVAELVQHAAATFVQHEANTNPMITITRVDLSPDLTRALIFFTTIPDGRENDALIFLQRSAHDLRDYLKSHARLKRIPHLDFLLDAGERHRQHIDELVGEIHKPK
ncbi:MAG: ribosome-binding factor A [Patescibacteria group bacterium]